KNSLRAAPVLLYSTTRDRQQHLLPAPAGLPSLWKWFVWVQSTLGYPAPNSGLGHTHSCFSAPAEEKGCSWLNIWVFLIFSLAIKTAIVTICLVALLDGSSGHYKILLQNSTEWFCVPSSSAEKVDGWMCCPKGWRRFQGSCYFLSSDTMSWDESAQNCTGMGSQLVVITSKAEQVSAQGPRERDPAGRATVLGPGGDSEPLRVLQGRGKVLSAPLQDQPTSATSSTPQGF
uniref:Uncharacterized protein n=1 Tax=Serinus canaria TaxID=9135 RepID=A0A8C9NQU6_SERCA